jgi:hypothetical protein
MMTRTITTAASILLAAASVSVAQNTETNMIFHTQTPPGSATYQFISSEMTIDGKVVKGQPYSAKRSLKRRRCWLTATVFPGKPVRCCTATARDGRGASRPCRRLDPGPRQAPRPHGVYQ